MQLPNLVEKYLFLKKLQRFYEKIQKIKLTKLIQMQNNNNEAYSNSSFIIFLKLCAREGEGECRFLRKRSAS
jgi:hypothetical protein